MKVSRDYLKQIVKECLIEILSEGLNVQQSTTVQPQRKFSGVAESTQRRQQPRRPSPLDQPATVRHSQQSNAIREAVKQTSGGNPMLAEMLADTANTTLQSMIKNDMPGSTPVAGDAYARVVAESAPEDLFGDEAASKWAALAFMDSGPKKSA